MYIIYIRDAYEHVHTLFDTYEHVYYKYMPFLSSLGRFPMCCAATTSYSPSLDARSH